MGFLSFLDPALDFMFGWTLLLTPFWALLIMSFLISLVIVVIYKWTTDQKLMKDLKDETKAFQKQMKELKAHPEEMMKVQKKAMQTNMKYMTHSMRPTLITFIPIILIFGWLQGHLAVEPIMPGHEFSVEVMFEKGITGNITAAVPDGIRVTGEHTKVIDNGKAVFTFKGDAGTYRAPGLDFTVNDKTYTKEIIIGTDRNYETPLKVVKDKTVKSINTMHEKTIVMNLLGWKLGWLGTYIIFALVFSLVLRKLMKVY